MSKTDSNISVAKRYVEEGNQLREDRKLDEAIEKFLIALQQQPNLVPALSQIARIYEAKREFKQATSYLEQLVKLQPEHIGFKNRLDKAIQNQEVEEKYGKILIANDFASPTEERERLQQTISQLQQSSQPIYLQFGFGRTPFSNFLNIDVNFIEFNGNKPPVPAQMHDRIFIFPWLDSPLPIPDNSVDFVFHQDLFEHLSQMQQFLLLAEVWRILKPGCFHRINTPCLQDSMKVHSKFHLGLEGVHRNEWEKWGHVNLITKNMIDEMAQMVGYKQAHFNSKNGSVSGVEFTETRPGGDRNEVTGNVFVDLIK
jgi:hypothetical protein